MSKVVGSQPKMKVTKTNKKGRGQEREENLPYPSFPPIFFFFHYYALRLCFSFTCRALGPETTAMHAMPKCGFWKTSKC